jgi:hypothetical protein
MNKYMLQSQIKSTGTAYVLWFFLGAHFAYLGKWGIQILFWITLGGFGLWWFIELFLTAGRIERHNAKIYMQIDDIEKREKSDDLARNIAMINASKG